MCGVAGYVAFTGPPTEDVLAAMRDALSHRGPDGSGVAVDGPCGLAHTRLAIIDLSAAAAQPMRHAAGRYTISYNGEVYNFREIRRELENLGHRFVSNSDTEVVLAAWVEWGRRSVLKFNGMFAFALWDREEQTLFLARDRYGVKPLYYAHLAAAFVFGSEIKAILCHPDYVPGIDQSALVEYLTFQNYFTDRTLFRGVKMLPAGCILTLRAGAGSTVEVSRYWDFDFRESAELTDEEGCVEELDRLFQQAVTRQLVSDVEVGSYLSGGVDSGGVTAIAAKSLPYIKTFTCGFDLSSASGLELAFDEREAAEELSYLYRTEHYEMVLKAGDMERVMPRLTWHLEEPRVGQSYPNFYIAQLASKFVNVALAGTGGDELFGGYPWRYYRAVVNANFDEYVDKYYAFWQRLIPNTGLEKILGPIWSEVRHISPREIFRGVFKRHADQFERPEDYVNHSLYLEAKTFLHGLLVVEDKLSMAHGLETRVPYLDNDLVDFAMRLPVRMKVANLAQVVRRDENEPGPKSAQFFSRTRDGKLLLRKIMQRHVPLETTQREKQGFSAPDASWFRGESIEYVRRSLLNPRARIYDFLDRAATRQLIDLHLNGTQNLRLLIWSLLSLENWLGTFLPARASAATDVRPQEQRAC